MLSPGGARGVQRLNSTGTLIQRTTTEAPRRTYVLHRTGRSQEDNQLLREGCQRSGSSGRQDWSNTTGVGRLDKDSSSTMERRHGSHDFHGLDLRSSAAPRCPGEGGTSADVARHRGGEKEE